MIFVKGEFSFLSFKNEFNSIVEQSKSDYDVGNSKRYITRIVESEDSDRVSNCHFEFDDLEMYRVPIGIYVSDSVPDLDINDAIILSSNVCRISNNYLALDPCWPFLVKLSPSEDELMQEILNNGRAIVDVDNFDMCVRFLSMGIALPEREL